MRVFRWGKLSNGEDQQGGVMRAPYAGLVSARPGTCSGLRNEAMQHR
jgi:hypothetical protein